MYIRKSLTKMLPKIYRTQLVCISFLQTWSLNVSQADLSVSVAVSVAVSVTICVAVCDFVAVSVYV